MPVLFVQLGHLGVGAVDDAGDVAVLEQEVRQRLLEPAVEFLGPDDVPDALRVGRVS